jgi:long-chain acyl-CoA synthetase
VDVDVTQASPLDVTVTLFDRADENPEGIAVVDAGGEHTWADVTEQVTRTANALATLKLPPGSRLAVVGENTAATLLTYAACVVGGVSAILVNYHLSADELGYVFIDGAAGAVWATPEHVDVAGEAARRVGVPLLTDEPGGGWAGAVAAADRRRPSLDRAPADDLIYTSGTTGVPKGVLVPPRLPATLAERLDQLARHHAAGLGPHLVVGPLYHGGPHASVGLLLTGTTVVIPGRFDAALVLDLIERYSIASSVMVPTHFVRLLALPPERRAAADVSSLRMIAHTGSTCPPHVKRAMIDWFGPIFRESYGASESGILSFLGSEEWLAKPGSVGKVQPPIELLVLDDDGAPCPAGSDGTLYFRDPTGRGIRYHNDPEKTAAAHLEPGVFTMGDRGHVEEDGYLYITGRRTDMVISGGVNIYPAECERVLVGHPAVVDAAVFGVPDDEMGERLVGVVCVVDDTVDAATLIEYCRERIAHYKVPRRLHLVDEIPRSPMGKTDKPALQRCYGPRAASS